MWVAQLKWEEDNKTCLRTWAITSDLTLNLNVAILIKLDKDLLWSTIYGLETIRMVKAISNGFTLEC